MKQLIALFLIFMVLLSGCTAYNTITDQEIALYYVKTYDPNEPTECMIAPEMIDSHTLSTQPEELIKRYLQGPSDLSLYSCYPENTTLIGIEDNGKTMQITLSDQCADMDPLSVTLSGSCLAKTLFPYTEVAKIVITAENGFTQVQDAPVFDRDNIQALDSSQASGT